MRTKTNLTHEEYLSLIYQVFTTRKGKLLLEIWTDQFLYRKSYQDGDDIGSVAYRDGEKGFILSIINLIEQQQEINKGQ